MCIEEGGTLDEETDLATDHWVRGNLILSMLLHAFIFPPLIIIIISVCRRAGLSLQIQAPRPEFCPKAGLPLQTQEPRLQFYYGWIGAVTSHCFLHPILSLASEKIPGAPAWRWREWIWLTGPSGLHWNSPQGLNISSIGVFDQIRGPEIPITLRPLSTSR